MGEAPGRRRFITVDLAGEEDPAFRAWLEEKIAKRRLSHEVREGLRLRWVLAQHPLGGMVPGMPQPVVQPQGYGSPGHQGRSLSSQSPVRPDSPNEESPALSGPGGGEPVGATEAGGDESVQEKLQRLLEGF